MISDKLETDENDRMDGDWKEEKTLAEQYLYTLFEPLTEETIAYGKMAFIENGFTDKGWFYLAKAMGLSNSMLVFAVGIVPFFLFVLIVFYKKEMLYKEEKQEWKKEIFVLKQSQMEEEYAKKQQKRMQSFIENIAHQIKTPISRVFTSLDILEIDLEETACFHIEECYSHLESVQILLKRLIDIGRLEAGKVIFRKDVLFLHELLEETIDSFGEYADRILLSYEFASASMKNFIFYGDGDWLKEAFLNIIKNAMEANESEEPIEVHYIRTNDFFKISIRDHGKGIKEADIPNIFDRFYLPKDVKSNHTGIGLNLAKLIIEGHRGSVYVYNHAEGGAVFQVILPIYESLKITESKKILVS